MKKILLFFFLLVFTFSFSQTKKKKIKQKINTTTSKVNEIPNQNLEQNQINNNNDASISLLIAPLDDNVTLMDMNNDYNKVYNPASVEVKPEFPGGLSIFLTFFKTNFKLSEEMINNKMSGRILATFTVEKDGTLSDIKIIKDLGFGSGNETIRVLKTLPKWIPAMQNGKNIRCSYSIPINIDARN